VNHNPLPVTTPVPVFDCHVLLTKPASPGERWQARCARAPQIIADGATERETLMAIVSRFKFFVHEHHVKKEPIPWADPALSPGPGEVERFIPVHL
jgi:hypothetical protein